MDGATVIVHVPPELLLWLEREAVAAGRTRNDEVVALLELGRVHTERLRESEAAAVGSNLADVSPFGEVDDGFGNAWPRCGSACALELVRPGKVQCACGGEPFPGPSAPVHLRQEEQQ